MAGHTRLLAICFLIVLHSQIIPSNMIIKTTQIIPSDDKNASDFSCDFQPTTACPCQRTNNTVLCCNMHQYRSTGCSSDNACFAMEIIVSSSSLESSIISEKFFMNLGICAENVKTLIIRNSRIRNVTFNGLQSLEILDLRGNLVGALFREPDISSIKFLYLSGLTFNILCKLQMKNIFGLGFGLQMSWLLGEIWGNIRLDQNITFCGNIQKTNLEIESKLTVSEGLTPFLRFAQVFKTN
jgi:hypothetical protein